MMSMQRVLRAWRYGTLLSAVFMFSAASSAAINDLDALAEAASDTGWVTAREDDGSLLLFPGISPSEQNLAAGAAAQAKEPESDPLASLEERLRETKWKVQRDSDGSLLLYPHAAGLATADAVPVAPALEEPDMDVSGQISEPDAFGQLASVLRERNSFQVERDSDGSLLFYPRADQDVAPHVPASSEDGSADVTVNGEQGQHDALAQVARVLNERGWRTGRDQAGNLLLFVG